MKKYHIADLLTLSRFLLAVALFVLVFTISEPKNRLVLLLFSLGSLTDALDGEFARKYPYPKDGKARWWRKYQFDYDLYQYEINDIVADLLLGLATLVYIAKWISPLLGGFYLGASIGVGLFVYFVTDQAVFNTPRGLGTFEVIEEIRTAIVLYRRKWYGGGIAIVIFTLILAAKFHVLITIPLILLGMLIGIYIIYLKRETRLKQDKTPLP